MKTLVVEDDFISRVIMTEILKSYGTCHVAVNGIEAVQAFTTALNGGEPYDLICMDVMMPQMDGHAALQEIREIEEKSSVQLGNGVKVIMTTAMADNSSVMKAFKYSCDAYLVKPVKKDKIASLLKELGLPANA